MAYTLASVALSSCIGCHAGWTVLAFHAVSFFTVLAFYTTAAWMFLLLAECSFWAHTFMIDVKPIADRNLPFFAHAVLYIGRPRVKGGASIRAALASTLINIVLIALNCTHLALRFTPSLSPSPAFVTEAPILCEIDVVAHKV